MLTYAKLEKLPASSPQAAAPPSVAGAQDAQACPVVQRFGGLVSAVWMFSSCSFCGFSGIVSASKCSRRARRVGGLVHALSAVLEV